MHRQIEVTCEEPALEIDQDSVMNCLLQLDAMEQFAIPDGSLGIAFVKRETSSQLHLRFFGDPAATDVMTFPGDPGDGHAGDIAICPSIAAASCRTEGTTFREELTLYLVHAFLHLAGLDDRDRASIREMRAAESQLMQHLQAGAFLIQADWMEK